MVSIHFGEREKAVAKACLIYASLFSALFAATFFAVFLILKFITVVVPLMSYIFKIAIGLRTDDANFCALLVVVVYALVLSVFFTIPKEERDAFTNW